MVARPAWTADPLRRARRPNARIVSHGVVVGVVEIVRPLIDIPGDRLGPFWIPDLRFGIGEPHATRRQHPLDLLPRHATRACLAGAIGRRRDTRHHHIHRAARIWQALPVPHIGRNPSVDAGGHDLLASGRNATRVRVDQVDQERVRRFGHSRQLRDRPPVAPNVNDKPAGDAGLVDDTGGDNSRGERNGEGEETDSSEHNAVTSLLAEGAHYAGTARAKATPGSASVARQGTDLSRKPREASRKPQPPPVIPSAAERSRGISRTAKHVRRGCQFPRSLDSAPLRSG